MRPLRIAAVLIALLAMSLPASAEQAKHVVDIAVPADGDIQRLTLTDGSTVFGRVDSIETDAIVFRSVAGVTMTVPRANIVDLRLVEGRIVGREFLPQDPHNTRLMFAPTGRSLRRGEGYFGLYEISMPFVQVGITDRLSVGGGTPLIFLSGGDFHPVWFTPKFQVIARDTVQAAAGVIHVTGTDGHDAGIAYGVTTFGRFDNAATVGFGYAYSGHNRTPIVMLGGEYRQSRRIKWITENWLWKEDGNGFVSGGMRFIGERLSADLSLLVPLVDEGFVFPVVSFAWAF
jgi:hypothetical protein